MSKKLFSNIFFIVAIIDVAVGVVNITNDKALVGFTYLFLSTTFVALGLRYRKNLNKK